MSPPFWLAKYQALVKCRAIDKNYFVLFADAINPIQSLHLVVIKESTLMLDLKNDQMQADQSIKSLKLRHHRYTITKPDGLFRKWTVFYPE